MDQTVNSVFFGGVIFSPCLICGQTAAVTRLLHTPEVGRQLQTGRGEEKSLCE